jgi:hypothetical protein
MNMVRFANDPDEFRGDFIRYLAERFGVSEEAALSCLGDWLTAVADNGSLARSAMTNGRRCLSTKEKWRG